MQAKYFVDCQCRVGIDPSQRVERTDGVCRAAYLVIAQRAYPEQWPGAHQHSHQQCAGREGKGRERYHESTFVVDPQVDVSIGETLESELEIVEIVEALSRFSLTRECKVVHDSCMNVQLLSYRRIACHRLSFRQD